MSRLVGHILRYLVSVLAAPLDQSDVHCGSMEGRSLHWKSEGESFSLSGRAQLLHLASQTTGEEQHLSVSSLGLFGQI